MVCICISDADMHVYRHHKIVLLLVLGALAEFRHPGTQLGGEHKADDDVAMAKRGQRESPRTPTDAAKIAKLDHLSKKLSPSVLPMPGAAESDASGSGYAATPVMANAEEVQPSQPTGQTSTGSGEPSNADIMARLGSMMENMATNMATLQKSFIFSCFSCHLSRTHFPVYFYIVLSKR